MYASAILKLKLKYGKPHKPIILKKSLHKHNDDLASLVKKQLNNLTQKILNVTQNIQPCQSKNTIQLTI